MDSSPLVTEQIEAGARFLAEFNRYAPLAVAFWMKESGKSWWGLYVASDQIKDVDVRAAHAEIGRITAGWRNPYFDAFTVRILLMSDPRTRAALDYYRLYPDFGPIRLGETFFGDVTADGVYLYPLPQPAVVA